MCTRRGFLARGSLAMLGTALAAGGVWSDHLVGNRTGPPAKPEPPEKGTMTPAVDKAIARGLAYLEAQQHPNGSFGTYRYQGNVAVTSLAALAMMAGGHLPGRGPKGKVVNKALSFVLDQEEKQGGRPTGYLYNPRMTPSAHGPMYGQGFGTLFLAELHGMVEDDRLRTRTAATLGRAVELILKSQNSEGGWRYHAYNHPSPRDADISVTVCQIMALRSARNAGFAVPKSKVDECIRYVKRCQDRQFGWFHYTAQGDGDRHQAFARTAAGVAALQSAGIYEGEEIRLGLKFLRDNHLPTGGHHPSRRDIHYFYGHYYAGQAMWTAGGEFWSTWWEAIRDELVRIQQQNGFWPDLICSHYATAMACLILQIPNNYLPILQK